MLVVAHHMRPDLLYRSPMLHSAITAHILMAFNRIVKEMEDEFEPVADLLR